MISEKIFVFLILPKNERKISALVGYSRFRNKHSPRLINFQNFFQGLRPYSGLYRAYFSSISIRYKWGNAYFLLPNYPGATFIPDSRVGQKFGFSSLLFERIEDTKISFRD